MAGDANDVEVPKISRSITFIREAFWVAMWRKISSRFATYVIEKSISLPRVLHGSASLNQDRRGEICSQEISRANIFNCTKTVENTEEELSLRSVPCGELNPGFSRPIFRRNFAPMRQRLIIRDVFSERRLVTFPILSLEIPLHM